MIKNIELYCIYLIDLPEYITKELTTEEDALIVNYNTEENIINFIEAGEVDGDDFGGEFIINKRLLEINPFTPIDELYLICRQSI